MQKHRFALLWIFAAAFLFLAASCKKDNTGDNSSFTEGFDNVNALLSKGWAIRDNSYPLGVNWVQGDGQYIQAQSGSSTSYISSTGPEYDGVHTFSSSSWLITPVITFKNGDKIIFYTVSNVGSHYYTQERLQLRRNTANTGTNVGSTYSEVGDFTTLLKDINYTEAENNYPTSWQRNEVIITDLAGPAKGRLAFRYFLNSNGYHSEGIAIDSLAYISAH